MSGISREQVVNRLREAGYSFQRQADRVEIHRQRGSGQRVNIPRRDLLPEVSVQVILKQAGLGPAEIDAFMRGAVKG